MIEERIGAERFGISIGYSYDGPELDGTLGAVRRALPLLGERFLVLYGDTYLPMDYQAASMAWQASGKPALMTVFRNEGRWDDSNVVYRDGVVVKYDKRQRTADMSWIDYGLGGFAADILGSVDSAETDLSGLQRALAEGGLLCGFEATERFYEIGTPESLRETEEYLSYQGNRDGS
jgi:NDP-sugar pyrophosphorylase family protein